MDVPRDSETYLHRIGRAGRFGELMVIKPFQSLSVPEYSGDAVAEWLVRWTPDRAVWAALALVIVLCSWARPLTLTVLLSTQEYNYIVGTSKLLGQPNQMLGGNLALE